MVPPAKRQRTATVDAAFPAPVAAEFDEDPLDAVYPLVGRERECGELDRFLDCPSHRDIANCIPSSGSLYVSGGPGTGKTCCVRAAVAAWGQREENAKVFEVNCMELAQRTVSGLLCHLGQQVGIRTSGLTGQNLVAALARGLAVLSGPIAIIVDEVDQLVRGGLPIVSGPLSTLLSLPHTPGAPPIALVAIANAVDLLDRTLPPANRGCSTLLFEPYTAAQLKQIVQDKFASEGTHGGSPGGIAFELRLRQTAKQSGDCRRAIALCKQALCADATAREERKSELRAVSENAGDTGSLDSAVTLQVVPSVSVLLSERAPKVAPVSMKLGKSGPLDPISMIEQLPLGQQIVLCVLANAQTAASRAKDICTRYKEYCRFLHQPLELASRAQVSDVLAALEQRGLISLRAPPKMKNSSASRKAAMSGGAAGDCVAELTVSREVVRTTVLKATPVLQRCFQ